MALKPTSTACGFAEVAQPRCVTYEALVASATFLGTCATKRQQAQQRAWPIRATENEIDEGDFCCSIQRLMLVSTSTGWIDLW